VNKAAITQDCFKTDWYQ